jgi:hypothetical protein
MDNLDPKLLKLLNQLSTIVASGEADSTDIQILAELFEQNPEYARIFDENRLQKRCSTLLGRGSSLN